jgi:hypothetical protein
MASGFSIPGDKPKAQKLEDLPASVQDEIKQGVFKFESKFAGLGMLALARMNGWIDEFRDELVLVASIARSAK